MSAADRDAALILIGVLVTCLVAGGAAVVIFSDDAAAQEEDDSVLGDLTSEQASGFAAGIRGRIGALLSGLFDWGEPETTAPEACADLRETVSTNSAAIQPWVNNRTTANTSLDVLAIECVVEDTSETDYIIADVDNGSYVNGTMVDATGREVDETCVLEDDAAVRASAEAETFVEEFAEPDEPVSEEFMSRLTAQYGGKVSCSFMGDA
jgi:hypothetical protein